MTPKETFDKHYYVIRVGLVKFFGSLGVAKRIANNIGMEFSDLEQYAAMAVWEVALKHDSAKHDGFYFFAIKAIRDRLGDVVRRKKSLLKLPQANADELHKTIVIKCMDKTVREYGPEEFTLHDVIPNHYNLESYVIKKLIFEDQMNKVCDISKQVLYMLLNGMTEPEVAQVLGVTRGGVSVKKRRALQKMHA